MLDMLVAPYCSCTLGTRYLLESYDNRFFDVKKALSDGLGRIFGTLTRL